MESNNEESGLLLNLIDECPFKKRSEKTSTHEKKDLLSVSPHKKNGQSNPVNRKSKTSFNEQLSPGKEKVKMKRETIHAGGSKNEILHSSSLFKSNPEIPILKMDKSCKGVSEPLFSKKTFDDLNLHPHLISCLKNRMEVVTLTTVQEKTIPHLLNGCDLLVKSCTGSGKTLSYAVPIVQKLQEMTPKIKRSDGIFCLIVVPTRELALQCYECFSTLTKAFTWIVPGYLIGGEKKKSEKARLRKGINILISTAGRLLDHLDSTACLTLENIHWLVIDEADNLLDQGFEESVTKIVSKCNQSRQTVLLSATLTKGVERLAGISLKNPVHIDLASEGGEMSGEFQEFAIPSNLKQCVVIVPSKLRLAVISAFIVDKCLHTGFKGLIFMGSQSSVDFHYSLLSSILGSILKEKGHKLKIFRLHGNMKQEERTQIFSSFHSIKQGVLLCTDVAARGLDLPHVDWIVQYSAPQSAEIYVHRVGRTARIGKKGSALLFLLPSENQFSLLLSQHKIQFDEIDANQVLQSLLLIGDVLTCKSNVSAEDCATALQTRYEKEIYSEDALHESAKEAFASYVQFYASYPKNIRHILPFKALHLGHVAKSFCLREAPSELGCALPRVAHSLKFSRKNDDKKLLPQKRKHTGMISEYDSGLASLKHNDNMKTKRRKHH